MPFVTYFMFVWTTCKGVLKSSNIMTYSSISHCVTISFYFILSTYICFTKIFHIDLFEVKRKIAGSLNTFSGVMGLSSRKKKDKRLPIDINSFLTLMLSSDKQVLHQGLVTFNLISLKINSVSQNILQTLVLCL